MSKPQFNIYLDDIRTPRTKSEEFPNAWVVLRSYDKFVDFIRKHGLPEFISFDHDLGDDVARSNVEKGMSKRKARTLKKETKSGYDCAQWLINYCMDNHLPLPGYEVHSMNPVGKENILSLLDNYKKRNS